MIVSTVIIVPLHTFVAKTKPNQTKGSNNISQRLSNQVVNKLIIPELTGVVSFCAKHMANITSCIRA
jgi:hypothetical protein